MRWDALRARANDAAPRVTNMELFFDLVYVFAITQLSDFLFAHLSFRGALEGLIMFAAVWWAWNYTAWATNWIDPESIPGAALMILLMAISLVMSAAIPQAFEGRGLRSSRSPTWRSRWCARRSWSGSLRPVTRCGATSPSCWRGRALPA